MCKLNFCMVNSPLTGIVQVKFSVTEDRAENNPHLMISRPLFNSRFLISPRENPD
ncbi:hypothetical protein HOLDEFILI_00877 [Holdemania filiformis DSM 12042]|uniref:Uncharacterized protein n=1 Tax=Holdemania filiformis DSM 12042 TaxID=545696 RepID=B9Y4Z5_9FIRM|nr:hypothetical protein HOLDEFILI_00877 [Holdemania filiformis DSM 12042]